ncbi:MAG TPA: LuxR C-terminal-related transcriptional regulator [Pseudonocardiaceae bacterium]|jgi:DNA-binding CsgD family transcriptional regulator|nr:LuxR C-terminal-related transcriptional regulator [Pseudonocardiaceae bacterium]
MRRPAVPLDPATAVTIDPGLLGRTAEVGHIASRFRATSSGGSQVVRVRGPAGIGKTALLDAVDYLDVVVLRAGYRDPDAEPSTRDFDPRLPLGAGQPYAVVHELLAPLTGPPSPTRGKGHGNGAPTDSTLRALCEPVLTQLAGGPVVLVLDNLHRFDANTVRWLDYLLRRCTNLPLFALLAESADQPVGAKPVHTELFARHDCHTVELHPFDLDTITELLESAFGEPPHRGFSRCCARASLGNPGLLRDLIDRLHSAGARPDEASTHLATSMGNQIAAQAAQSALAGRPDHVRRVAGAIAVLGGTTVELISSVAEVPPRLVHAAIQTLRGDGVFAGATADFAVEAMRGAVLDGIPDDAMRALRTRAVRVLNDTEHPVGEIAEQLLRLSIIDEPWMFDVLRDAAAVAVQRRAATHAVRYLTRLLECEPDCPTVRLDLAGALLGSDLESAVEHLELGLAGATEPRIRARLAVKYGWASLVTRTGVKAVRVLAQTRAALDAELPDPPTQTDTDLRNLLDSMLAVAGSEQRSLFAQVSAQMRAAAPAAAGTPAEQHLLAVRAVVGALDGADLATVVDDANRALRSDEHEPGGWSATTSARALYLADKVTPALEALDRAVTQSRRRHDGWTEYLALSVRAQVLGDVGEVDRADADAESALRAADRAGRPTDRTLPTVALARALLARSQLDRAERLLDGLDAASFADFVWEYHPYLMARAEVLYQRNDYDGALRVLTECGRSLAEAGIRNPVFAPWWMQGTWMLVHLDRRAEAADLAATGEDLVDGWRTPRAVGYGLLARSMVTPGTAGIDLLAEAVSVLERSPARFEHVRAQYLLGHALLRSGDKVAARERLRESVLLATRYGFTSLSRRARDLLLAAGGRMPPTSTRLTDVLTSSERRVAELAADGASNRDIAETLFVTLRTVEFHLNNIYRKLGLDSRAGLAAALVSDEMDPSLLGTRPIAHPLSGRRGIEVNGQSE